MLNISQSPSVHLTAGDAKASVESRIEAGTKVATVAVSAPSYSKADVKVAVDGVINDTAGLKTRFDKYITAKANFENARSALATGVLAWDGSFDILLTVGEKNCTTEAEATALAIPVLVRAKNTLAPPLSIGLTYDRKAYLLRVHVHRAPGMNVVCAEWTTDPDDATSWKEFEGCGARHVLKNPPLGNLYVRAASKTGRGKSDFTTPVAILVT